MKRNLLEILVLTVIFILFDQLTKQIALRDFLEPVSLIDGFLQLSYAENVGIAFSLAVPPLLTVGLTYLLLFAGAYIASKELRLDLWVSRLLLALVVGGAIGNLIDRSFRGYVIDFIDFRFWPIFNLADVEIVVGILGILLFYDKISRRKV